MGDRVGSGLHRWEWWAVTCPPQGPSLISPGAVRASTWAGLGLGPGSTPLSPWGTRDQGPRSLVQELAAMGRSAPLQGQLLLVNL